MRAQKMQSRLNECLPAFGSQCVPECKLCNASIEDVLTWTGQRLTESERQIIFKLWRNEMTLLEIVQLVKSKDGAKHR